MTTSARGPDGLPITPLLGLGERLLQDLVAFVSLGRRRPARADGLRVDGDVPGPKLENEVHLAAAQLRDALLTPQALEHDADLLLGRELPARCTPEVPHDPFRRLFHRPGFLLHLRS